MRGRTNSVRKTVAPPSGGSASARFFFLVALPPRSTHLPIAPHAPPLTRTPPRTPRPSPPSPLLRSDRARCRRPTIGSSQASPSSFSPTIRTRRRRILPNPRYVYPPGQLPRPPLARPLIHTHLPHLVTSSPQPPPPISRPPLRAHLPRPGSPPPPFRIATAIRDRRDGLSAVRPVCLASLATAVRGLRRRPGSPQLAFRLTLCSPRLPSSSEESAPPPFAAASIRRRPGSPPPPFAADRDRRRLHSPPTGIAAAVRGRRHPGLAAAVRGCRCRAPGEDVKTTPITMVTPFFYLFYYDFDVDILV
jgi:hypothetical protein